MGRYSLNLMLLLLMAAMFCACPRGPQEQAADSPASTTPAADSTATEPATDIAVDSGSVQALSPAIPSLNISLLNGERKLLSDYKGKPLVVNFWAEW